MASRALVVRESSTHLRDISQPIAGAPDGLDDDLLVLARTEFPAEAAYMGFDDRRPRIEMKIPDMLEQHRPGDNLARMPHQVFKKAEFAGLQFNLSIAVPAATPRKVDFEIADATHAARLRQGRASSQSVYSRGEFGERERLDEVVVGAAFQSLDTIADAIYRRQEKQRCPDVGGANNLYQSQSIEPRQ